MNKIIRYLAFLLLSFTVMSCDSSDEMKDITISPKEEVKPQGILTSGYPFYLRRYGQDKGAGFLLCKTLETEL